MKIKKRSADKIEIAGEFHEPLTSARWRLVKGKLNKGHAGRTHPRLALALRNLLVDVLLAQLGGRVGGVSLYGRGCGRLPGRGEPLGRGHGVL